MGTVDYRSGDYRAVAQRLLPAAEQLVAWCAPGPGELVVDVAAGSGNVAHLCAARGARVVATDLVPEQLALGRTPGDGIGWVAGDAQALPLRDGVADAALSTFGVIYARDARRAVGELARVCRADGRLGLTAWPVGGYQEGAAALLREALGDPGADEHIATWGTPERIAALIGEVADDVEVRTGELTVAFASVDEWWRARSASTPSIVSARRRLDDRRFAHLADGYRELARRCGTQDGDRFVLRDAYLVALGRYRPGRSGRGVV